MTKFGTAYLIGFFDHLHKGHKDALSNLVKLDAEKVVVLIPSDKNFEMLNKPFYKLAQSQKTRKINVEGELKKFGIASKSKVIVFEGFPPKELKNSIPLLKESAISFVVITAAKG